MKDFGTFIYIRSRKECDILKQTQFYFRSIHVFTCILPYFMRYDHHNYAKWGVIYLAEMHQLPAQVEEFKRGNFVVKRSNTKFNQVSPD